LVPDGPGMPKLPDNDDIAASHMSGLSANFGEEGDQTGEPEPEPRSKRTPLTVRWLILVHQLYTIAGTSERVQVRMVQSKAAYLRGFVDPGGCAWTQLAGLKIIVSPVRIRGTLLPLYYVINVCGRCGHIRLKDVIRSCLPALNKRSMLCYVGTLAHKKLWARCAIEIHGGGVQY